MFFSRLRHCSGGIVRQTRTHSLFRSTCLAETHRPVWAEIDLDAIHHNVREYIKMGHDVVAVVKADAYGHGAPLVAKEAVNAGAKMLAVAVVEEGIELRKSGYVADTTPILVLGLIAPGTEETVVKNRLIPTLCTEDAAHSLADVYAWLKKSANLSFKAPCSYPFHLKVDTGMGRIGTQAHDGSTKKLLSSLWNAGCSFSNGFDREKDGVQMHYSAVSSAHKKQTSGWANAIALTGIYTHFAKADERDKEYTKLQVQTFAKNLRLLKELITEGRNEDLPPKIFPLVHLLNSAGGGDAHLILDDEWEKEYGKTYTRLGISLYGMYPSSEVDKSRYSPKPVLSWKAEIAYIKEMSAGQSISYGGLYQVSRKQNKRIIATIPVGYADGYRRLLGYMSKHQDPKEDEDTGSEGGEKIYSGTNPHHHKRHFHVLCRGHVVPIVGRVCMDMFMVDVTDLPGEAVKAGEEVVLIGKQGKEQITIDEMADYLNTINYEIPCLITRRVPRVFVKNAHVVGYRGLDGITHVQDT